MDDEPLELDLGPVLESPRPIVPVVVDLTEYRARKKREALDAWLNDPVEQARLEAVLNKLMDDAPEAPQSTLDDFEFPF
jgi:hypothetical protein